MKRFFLILFLGAFAAAASAQTTPKAPATGSTTPKGASSASTTTKPSTAKSPTTASVPEPWIKLPPGIPRVAHDPVKIPFALRYEDIKVGAGPEGEAGKIWHIKYTGWRKADGVKFDSWDDHRQPVMGKDGKPELGPDGKPRMADPEPIAIAQGVGRVIPGFDYGLEGMKVGGKRRLFIPWQMAYGTHDIPDHPDHPGIPAKSDLVFDVELVDVTDMPQPHPMMPGVPPHPGASAQPNATPSAPAAPASSTAPASSAVPAANPATTAPAQPATTAQPATAAPAATAPAQPATPTQPTVPAQPQTQPK